MTNSKSIGKKIAEARKSANLTQSELAQKVSISPQAVGKWERGESMPDIITLNRITEIFGLDLNHFSENNKPPQPESAKRMDALEDDISPTKPNKNSDLNWDMSRGDWVDADFSGLKNLKEKFSGSNLKNCTFVNAELTDLIFKGNSIAKCDFTNSDWRNSKIHRSDLVGNIFEASSLIDVVFSESEVLNCDFSQANFEGAEIISCDFNSNKMELAHWKITSFKKSDLSNLIFDGTIEDCSFENCSFKKVEFRNATIINTFFKNNRKLNRIKFTDCKVDQLTYSFLKAGNADVSGIELMPMVK
ncbi:MAG: pentapeptide repeat-containing protein [Cryomorphaceae bacterium]|nr:pentapeptide repeat-containing protein [Cryomorphaceae bacterium]